MEKLHVLLGGPIGGRKCELRKSGTVVEKIVFHTSVICFVRRGHPFFLDRESLARDGQESESLGSGHGERCDGGVDEVKFMDVVYGVFGVLFKSNESR